MSLFGEGERIVVTKLFSFFIYFFRNRQAGDAKYVAKLSLEELKCFYEQVNNLPCIIPEAKLVKVSYQSVIFKLFYTSHYKYHLFVFSMLFFIFLLNWFNLLFSTAL